WNSSNCVKSRLTSFRLTLSICTRRASLSACRRQRVSWPRPTKPAVSAARSRASTRCWVSRS
ncbi:MAG: LSU ribosomal protein L29p (L35e), partial [uncultured Lysobacter sp.]